MKKIFYIILIMILSLTLTFFLCDTESNLSILINQTNTIWVSANPDIFFTVTKKDKFNVCYGILKTFEKKYNINMEFVYGSSNCVNIVDYDILKKNDFISKIEDIILRADCKFSEEKCIIKVTESSIDGIEVGDKITFKKVKELPDWATESAETSDES